jgi:cupin superfamily acireductone dioxygenase involved in methionine salvage
MEVYKTNTTIMQQVNSDQDEILNSLNSIEKELDLLLSGDVLHHKQTSQIVEFYNNPISKANSSYGYAEANLYEYRASRQQVFQKAFTIEQFTEEIANDLS